MISQDPRADNTDLYAFVHPNDTTRSTIVANYIPLEAPASGPNFPSFDDAVLYEIKIDNTGDGKDDIGYQFRVHDRDAEPGHVPLQHRPDRVARRPELEPAADLHRHAGPLQAGRQDREGRQEQAGRAGHRVPTPPDNIGPRSTPNYDALAAAAVTSLPGGVKVFAGQRDDPFFVDLGSIFDLAGLRPFNPFHLIPLAADPGVDALQHYNTHSIVLQVPIMDVVKVPNTNIGIYASASRQARTILEKDGGLKRRRPVRPDLTARQSADQRSGDPARPEGRVEPLGARGRLGVHGPLRDARGRSPREPPLRQRLDAGPGDGSHRPDADPAHGCSRASTTPGRRSRICCA